MGKQVCSYRAYGSVKRTVPFKGDLTVSIIMLDVLTWDPEVTLSRVYHRETLTIPYKQTSMCRMPPKHCLFSIKTGNNRKMTKDAMVHAYSRTMS